MQIVAARRRLASAETIQSDRRIAPTCLDLHMDALAECRSDLGLARERLVGELREHALVIGEVTLTSGQRAEYYVDAKRAVLRPSGFAALAALLAAQLDEWDA